MMQSDQRTKNSRSGIHQTSERTLVQLAMNLYNAYNAHLRRQACIHNPVKPETKVSSEPF